MPIARTRIPLVLLSLLALALPAGAEAAQTRKKSIWGPAEVKGVSQFPIYKDLGVGIWQNRINWSDVAPTGPPTRGIRAIPPTAGLPSWATRSRRAGASASAPRSSCRRPRLGERSPTPASCLEEAEGLRGLRVRGVGALPVRPTLDDLERADPSPELQATHQREARPSAHPENEASAASVRTDSRRVLLEPQGALAKEPGDRR